MNYKIFFGAGFGLLVLAGVVFGTVTLTGQSTGDYVEFDYIWTTAICDGNECRDFNVTCLDGKAIRMDPVTGMVIFPDDWVDGRSEEDKELCGR